MANDLLTRGKIANDLLNSILSTYDLDEADERWAAEAMCVAAFNLATSEQTECEIDCNCNTVRCKWIVSSASDFTDDRENLLALFPNDRFLGDIEYHDHHGYFLYRL